jgi:hypothetical protein
MAVQVAAAAQAEVVAVVVEGQAVVAVEMAPIHQAGVGTAIGVGSLGTGLIIAVARSPRRTRKNKPLRPKKKNQPSCSWRSTPLRHQI